ncbi:RNA polymerase sigma factor [Caulobacter sp. 17J65-9]|uniref:sigma-70 family RNA polymerase sigma factor n=1 Tax=Caulobacter sp. 17J65-9 TaxID=2709382 RepID=UPI0013C8DE62|nr:RNA polymerase sigma factor [Caulobacter sp. 17J65-9]
MDETQLIAAARAGSAEAFAALVRRHQQAVRGFLRRAGGDVAEADDLAQEAFIAAWSRIGAFHGRASLRSWLCAIAWRKLQTARRGAQRTRARERHVAQLEPSTTRLDPASDARLDLEIALAGLEPEQRAALALCLGADFSHAEAAHALGLPLGTVKSHVARGRARLAQALGADHAAE